MDDIAEGADERWEARFDIMAAVLERKYGRGKTSPLLPNDHRQAKALHDARVTSCAQGALVEIDGHSVTVPTVPLELVPRRVYYKTVDVLAAVFKDGAAPISSNQVAYLRKNARAEFREAEVLHAASGYKYATADTLVSFLSTMNTARKKKIAFWFE